MIGLVLALAAGTVVGASRMVAQRYEAAIPKDTLIAPEARPSAEPRSNLRGPLNFLLIGSDARDTNPEDGERSDTIIVANIDATLTRVRLISIPRDLRVRIPAFGPTGFRGSTEKINGAFQYGGDRAGGVQLLSATLTQMLGIRFDGAAVIDFNGFKKAVELLGGVHMCVDVRTESVHMGFDANGKYAPPYLGPEQTRRNPKSTPVVYEPGCREFLPWQALDFIRQRKTLPDGDYGRQRHQQQFLKALLDRALERGVATNPLEADRFIRAIGGSLTMDTNGVGIDELVFGLRNISSESLTGISMPSEPVDFNGYSYIAPLPAAEHLYAALRADTLDQWIAQNPTWANPV